MGLATIPIIAGRLGDARFGLLGLVWAATGLAGAVDMGLGRATVRFVADYLHRRSIDDVSRLVTASAVIQLGLGLLAGLAVAWITPAFVSGVLEVPPAMLSEARATFLILAVLLPFVLMSLNLRGVLEAAERFDLANLIRFPSSAATFLLPAIGAIVGLDLPGIMLLLLGARIVTCVAMLIAIRKAISGFRWQWPRDWKSVLPLMSYGGWVAISNLINPILTYFDRFLLASTAGLAAVAYYTAPYEAVTRLLILPAGLITALFPTFTVLSVRGEHNSLQDLLAQSVRHLVLILVIPAMLLVAFAGDLSTVWLGGTYAGEAAGAVQILTFGVFVNALAHLPNGFLQAVGRPDLPAKFHAAELPLYLLVAWILVPAHGISGAAMAWTFRVTLDAILLFGGVRWATGTSLRRLVGCIGWRGTSATGLFALALGAVVMIFDSPVQRLLLAGIVTAVVIAFAWHWVLAGREREAALLFVKSAFMRPTTQDTSNRSP